MTGSGLRQVTGITNTVADNITYWLQLFVELSKIISREHQMHGCLAEVTSDLRLQELAFNRGWREQLGTVDCVGRLCHATPANTDSTERLRSMLNWIFHWPNKFLGWVIRTFVLSRFYKIELSRLERDLANDTVDTKYVPAVRTSLIHAAMLLPALFLLDTEIVISVLIPATMVAGTAWFAVSLASMKKKFEDFGNELTRDLFIAFTLALCMLFLATAVSLTKGYWYDQIEPLRRILWLPEASAFLGIWVVGRLLVAIFFGSLKYDINDAMLTGQNEAAEKFFKKSLSVLHSTSESLRSYRSLQVANYSIGVAFYEVFYNVKNMDNDDSSPQLDALIDKANTLVRNPSMEKEEADATAIELVESFAALCKSSAANVMDHKSYNAIRDEIQCLKGNSGEDQEMIDVRLSVVFQEMSNLMEDFGEGLFDPEVFD